MRGKLTPRWPNLEVSNAPNLIQTGSSAQTLLGWHSSNLLVRWEGEQSQLPPCLWCLDLGVIAFLPLNAFNISVFRTGPLFETFWHPCHLYSRRNGLLCCFQLSCDNLKFSLIAAWKFYGICYSITGWLLVGVPSWYSSQPLKPDQLAVSRCSKY